MSQTILPRDIFDFLATQVLGQDDVLHKVAVALYKHIHGLGTGNVLLMGNSGTGKTTIMKAIRNFYASREDLALYRATTILNANILQGEQAGDVDTGRIFRNLETDIRTRFGTNLNPDDMQTYLEHATVCIDEVDKIASRILGKVNASGIGIQQALLTILEGENISFEPAGTHEQILLDTSNMFFLCGGAFEDLYDSVFRLISEHKDERRFRESLGTDTNGRISYSVNFTLKEYLKLSDLFEYGMAPQFVSRFSDIAVLENLGHNELRQILLTAPDSPLQIAKKYFQAMDFDLELTTEAQELILSKATESSRIGARALRETLGRVIAPMEFDPTVSPCLREEQGKKILTVDQPWVQQRLEQGR